ncbi:MAG: hypothetical protein Q8Q15_02400 [bacterium]|nr:hypothetical protein [bacterium]
MDWLSTAITESLGFVSPFLESATIVRAILGFILVFFLPGFTWSLVIFHQLTVIERVAFSFAWSIVVVTLSLLLANRLIGVSITGFNAALVVVIVTILPVVVYYLNRRVRGRSSSAVPD